MAKQKRTKNQSAENHLNLNINSDVPLTESQSPNKEIGKDDATISSDSNQNSDSNSLPAKTKKTIKKETKKTKSARASSNSASTASPIKATHPDENNAKKQKSLVVPADSVSKVSPSNEKRPQKKGDALISLVGSSNDNPNNTNPIKNSNQMKTPRVILPGSERKPITGGKAIKGAAERPDPNHYITVTIKVRPKAELPKWAIHSGTLSKQQLADDYGADEKDLNQVKAFAKENHLQVLEEDAMNCSLKISGSVENLEKAFGTKLKNVQVGKAIHRERTGHITIPKDLSSIITDVAGLDNRPQIKPHFRPSFSPRTVKSYTPLEVAELYNFPPGDGSGQTIAILEFGGGFTQSELKTYFSGLGLATPDISAVLLPGAQNLPTPAPKPTPANPNPPDPDAEVLLDIEVAGAVAPKAKINVYFAKDASDGSFVEAIDKAINDAPTVISISWGGPESEWKPSTKQSIDQSFARAAALSILVTVASGDDGSTDGTNPPILDVDFPSSSPHALACGGTHLEGGASISLENVWKSNGGGTGAVSALHSPSHPIKTVLMFPRQPVAGAGYRMFVATRHPKPDLLRCGMAKPSQSAVPALLRHYGPD